MKLNSFKYIFIIFAVCITIFAIVKIKKDEQKNNETIGEAQQDKKEIVTELNLGVASFDSMNPILSKNKNIQSISKIVFDSLITLTSDYKTEASLAKEWVKQNDVTYLIKLKENVKWSDGEKFTAEDVRFTIDRLKDSDTIYSSNVQHIIEIGIIDDYTLNITLDSEQPFFEYNLTFPILSNKFYSDKEFSLDIVPIGTGKYKVSEVQENALILKKNENYWDEQKEFKIDTITINLYSTAGELYNAFKTGNIDLISTQNSNLQDYIGTIGYFSKDVKGREHDFIAFNMQNSLLSNINIRKAISYSIDKTNIVSSIFNDKYYTSSFPLDFGSWIYSEQDSSSGYNMEQAKQILVNDGWEYKYKNWQKTINYRIQKISLNLVVKATDETRLKVAENIKTQLANVGIRINIIKASNEQYNAYLQNKNYDMILCSINLSTSPNMNTFFGENNLANYSNDALKEIMEEIKNSTDEEKLKNYYKKLGEIYKVDMPYLSLYNNRYTIAYTTTLAGTVEGNWFNQFYNIEDWHK